MHKLIPALIDSMGDAYPELKHQQTLIEKVVKEEEEAFLRTLETGIRLLDRVMSEAKNRIAPKLAAWTHSRSTTPTDFRST